MIIGDLIPIGGSGTLQPSEAIAPETFYNDDGKQVGTMVNRGAVVLTPSSVDQPIVVGYHNGLGKCAAVVVPVANVKVGTTIAGQAGTMPDKSGNVGAPYALFQDTTAGIQVYPPTGYYPQGAAYVAVSDPDYVASNILAGKDIFGLVGTAVDGAGMKKIASGVTLSISGSNPWTYLDGTTGGSNFLSVTGLSFKPSKVIIKYLNGGYEYLVVYEEMSGGSYAKSVMCINGMGNAGGSPINFVWHIKGDVAPVSVFNGGFYLPTYHYSANCTWTAIE